MAINDFNHDGFAIHYHTYIFVNRSFKWSAYMQTKHFKGNYIGKITFNSKIKPYDSAKDFD